MKKLLKYIGILLGIILFIWFILFLFPLSSDSERAFFEGDEGTLVIVHRGGLDHVYFARKKSRLQEFFPYFCRTVLFSFCVAIMRS